MGNRSLSQSHYLRVGLLWHSLRSDNLGVGALALSNLQIVVDAARRAGREARPVIVGYGGRLHYPPPGIVVEEHIIQGSRELAPFSRLWRTIGDCDVVLDIGAGDSWADIYGGKRFLWQWWSKEMTILQNRPLVFSPQTIGPFNGALTRQLAARTMRRARSIFARDAESLGFVADLGSAGIASETVDVAFRLPYLRPTQPRDGGKIRFGFNVSGLLYAGGYTGKDQLGARGAYRELVDGIITKALARGDADVVLVPHVVPDDGSVEDDVAVSRALAERYGVAVAPVFRSPSEAKSFIAGLDVLAGSRMHATIAAASAGVAVVPLAYSRKFRGVFQTIGYPLLGDYTTTGPAELVDLTLSAFDRRHELAAAARAGAERATKRLGVYEDELTRLFAQIKPRS
jgi:colanic acid/amylovoran biosynthesis protein